jgi:hypothetical protein
MGIQGAKNARQMPGELRIYLETKKKQGGLGVLNLRIQNQALLMKNLYKFYNHMDIPWVKLNWHAYYNNGEAPQDITPQGSFLWRDCMSLNESFRNITTCSINNGKTIQLWKDKWEDSFRKYDMPQLFSFAKDKDQNMASVHSINNESIYEMFHLPLSVMAHQQLHRLYEEI